MISSLILLLLFRGSHPVSTIPPSLSNTSVKCHLNAGSSVREIHPELGIVTGDKFISHFDLESCQLLSHQKHADTTCVNGVSDCTDTATSVVSTENDKLYYCYTNNGVPAPMSADLLANESYKFVAEGISTICLHDSNKASFVEYNAEEDLLYIASDMQYGSDPGYHYYNLTSNTVRSVPNWEIGGVTVDKFLYMFRSGDFLYTIYLDSEGNSKITRSCQSDLTDYSEIHSFTFSRIQCIADFSGTQLSLKRVLSAEYDPSNGVLYLLMTSNPVLYSSVSVCTFSVKDHIDELFDTSQYYYIDEDGARQFDSQDKVDCTVNRDYPVLAECVDPVSTSLVTLTSPATDLTSLSIWRVQGALLFYLSNGRSLFIYSSNEDSTQAELISEIALWAAVDSVKIHENTLYLSSDTTVFVSFPYWCSAYGNDPVTCLGSRHPACSYSNLSNRCVPTSQCTAQSDCVQSLRDGSFSKVYPTGHRFTVRGTVCENESFFTDTTYIYSASGHLSTSYSYRGCAPVAPTQQPVHGDDAGGLTGRETGLLFGMVFFGAAFLFLLLLFVVKTKPKVGICGGTIRGLQTKIKYNAEDKRAIVQTPTSECPSPVGATDPFGINGTGTHLTVFRNPSAGEDPLK